MHSANSERPSKGALHPIQESAQTAQAVSEISKGLQCALTAITIVALSIYIYIIQRITMYPHGYHHSGSMANSRTWDTGCAFTHCLDCIVESTRVLKLRAVSDA